MKTEPLEVIAGAPDRPLVIGDIEIPCYVLEDETRVLSQRGVTAGIGLNPDAGFRMPQFMASRSIAKYVSADSMPALKHPVRFKNPVGGGIALARIHRRTGMDGVRTGEGGEGVTGAMIRARIWVDGRLAGGLQALLGAPMAAYSGCGERDGGIGHGKRRSRTGLARVCGDVGLAGGSVADGRRQAGSGMARSRARARLNCSSQGQRRGRCRVNRRAERVIRPAKAKARRLRVLVVTIC